MTDPLPAIITPGLLDTLRSQENLPGDVWYIVVAATLCILNRPEEVQTVYKHAVAQDHSGQGRNGLSPADPEQLRIVRRLREALLKTSAIGGMPKVRKNRTTPPAASRRTSEARLLPGSLPPAACLPLPLLLFPPPPSPGRRGDLHSRTRRLTQPPRVDHQRPPGAQEGRTSSSV